jgi:hypothetical protein
MMMKTILFLFLSGTCLHAAAYTSTQTGNYSSTATWGGVGPPGNGDTFTVATATVVTVDVSSIAGTSGVNGTTAVTLAGTGQLVVGAGVTFTARGNVVGTSSAIGGTPLVTMNAGSTWEWDSSQAASPSTTQYELTASVCCTWVFLQANGTSASHVTVTSNTGGGYGYFDDSVQTVGGGIIATYTDFSNIDHFYPSFSSYGTIIWNVTNSTFTNCGIIKSVAVVPTTAVFIHSNNVHTATVGGYDMVFTFSTDSIGSGGVRQIENNVFDAEVGNSSGGSWIPGFVTITGNYFANCVQASPNAGIWALFQYNLVRESSGCFDLNGALLNNYVLVDQYAPVHIHNPDVGPVYTTPVIEYNIFDATYYASVNYPNDDGVVLDEGAPGAQSSATIKYNLVLPAGNGVGGQSLMDIAGENNATLDIEHNTVICSGVACVTMEYENDYLPDGYDDRGTLSNNIFMSLAANAGTVGALDANIENPLTDLFAPGSIQNNAQFNLKATGGADGSTNEGNGYWGAWSVTPGGSDIVGDPKFKDTTRNMATFDSAYLGDVASATWASESSGHTFNVGDIISDQNADYYGNAVINYRCIASHAKSTSDSEPGVGSAFQTYWEFASLNSIRNGIGSGATITDPSIGASGATYIQALMDWVTAGFAPSNQALKAAGTDGLDIGAVAVSSLAAGAAATSSSTIARR